MDNDSYSLMLRRLSDDYYHGQIEFTEYRSRRKIILDKIDEEFNGIESMANADDQQNDTSIFMQTVKFFKSSDLK